MNIGMVLEVPFPPDVRVENEARALVQAGHTIHIFSIGFGNNARREKFAEHIFLYRLKMNRWLYNKIRVSILRFPFYNSLWLRFLKKISTNLHLNAVHVHDLPLAKVGKALADEKEIPFVLDLHENYPAGLKVWKHTQNKFGRYFFDVERWSKYENKYVREADKVIVVTEEALERFYRIGIDPKKFVVVSNTLNLDYFCSPQKARENNLRQTRFTITYVGGFGPHRGLKVAIKAMPQILSNVPQTRLVLVGDGSDREELIKLVTNLQLNDHVEITGWARFNEIPNYIAKSDVCIIPYLSTEHTETTIPHKLFQYMYLKKPVVVSDCRPLKRIVNDADAGLVFKAGDSEDFARVVLQLRTEELRRELGMHGYQAVIKRYNWKNDGSRLVELYKNLELEKSGG